MMVLELKLKVGKKKSAVVNVKLPAELNLTPKDVFGDEVWELVRQQVLTDWAEFLAE
jgi:hypothetical protein